MKEYIDAVLRAEDELSARARETGEMVLEISKQAKAKIEKLTQEFEENIQKEKKEKFEILDKETMEYRARLEKQLNNDIESMKSYLAGRKKDIESRIIKTIIGMN
jgi:flagellar biosynthesis/type III secretory pathway protein FliH